MELIRGLGCRWLTRPWVNRLVKLDRQAPEAIGEAEIDAGGTVAHLDGCGLVRVSRIVFVDGNSEHWATDDLAQDELTRLGLARR
jgi:hypothetical protein